MSRSSTTSSAGPRRAADGRSTTIAANLVSAPAEGDWTTLGACRYADPDDFFVQGAAQNRVKTRCFGCVVRTECLADALDNRIEFGVWGGMTERQRRKLIRQHPEVTSWSRHFAARRASR